MNIEKYFNVLNARKSVLCVSNTVSDYKDEEEVVILSISDLFARYRLLNVK